MDWLTISVIAFVVFAAGALLYHFRGSRSVVLEVPGALRDLDAPAPADMTPTRVRITTPVLRDAGHDSREGDVLTIPAHCAKNWT